MNTTITLPSELGRQLRALAQHNGMTVTGYLAGLAAAETARAGIPNGAEPIALATRIGDSFPIRAAFFGKKPDIKLTSASAAGLADTLESMADAGGPLVVLDSDVEPFLKISRRGTGIVIESADNLKVSLSRDKVRLAVSSLRGAVPKH